MYIVHKNCTFKSSATFSCSVHNSTSFYELPRHPNPDVVSVWGKKAYIHRKSQYSWHAHPGWRQRHEIVSLRVPLSFNSIPIWWSRPTCVSGLCRPVSLQPAADRKRTHHKKRSSLFFSSTINIGQHVATQIYSAYKQDIRRVNVKVLSMENCCIL